MSIFPNGCSSYLQSVSHIYTVTSNKYVYSDMGVDSLHMHVDMHTYLHSCTHIQSHVCLATYLLKFIYIHICMHAYMSTYIHMHALIHSCIHIYIQTHCLCVCVSLSTYNVCIYMCINANTYIHSSMSGYIHTYKQAWRLIHA